MLRYWPTEARLTRWRNGQSYPWLVLATVGLGTLTSTVDGSIVNIALPTLGKTFHKDVADIAWVTVAYLLISVSLMLTMGKVGDAMGRKRVFLVGFLIFTVGLSFSAVSQSFVQLLGGRVVQAVGAAMITANGTALVVDAFSGHQRGRALGILGSIVGVGLMSGPPLGGFLLDLWGWRSIFFLRIPFGFLFILLTAMLLRPDSRKTEGLRFDYTGAVSLSVALSALILTVNRGPKLGWTEPLILAIGATAVLALGVFIHAELRARLPVLDLSLFRSRLFTMANLTNLLQFLSQGSLIILLPFFLLQGMGLEAGEAGLILAIMPAIRLFISPPAGWLADHMSSRTLCTLGLVIMMVGFLGLRLMDVTTPLILIVGMLLIEGIGTSIFGPANNSAVMGSVPPTHLGTGSAMIGTVREVGFAIGIALFGAVFSVRRGFHEAQLAGAGLAPEEAARQGLVLGVQETVTLTLVFIAAAVVASAFRGRDNPAGSRS